jgi:hypothetical protein
MAHRVSLDELTGVDRANAAKWLGAIQAAIKRYAKQRREAPSR